MKGGEQGSDSGISGLLTNFAFFREASLTRTVQSASKAHVLWRDRLAQSGFGESLYLRVFHPVGPFSLITSSVFMISIKRKAASEL